MFSLTVFLGTGMWSLMFRSKEAAELARDSIASAVVDSFGVVDDFGHQMWMNKTSIHGVVLEDLEKSKLAHCERALHQQKTQIMAQNMAQADTTIRNARFSNGPAVLQPVVGRPNGSF